MDHTVNRSQSICNKTFYLDHESCMSGKRCYREYVCKSTYTCILRAPARCMRSLVLKLKGLKSPRIVAWLLCKSSRLIWLCSMLEAANISNLCNPGHAGRWGPYPASELHGNYTV